MKEQSQQHCECVAETAGVDCVIAHGVIERKRCAKIRVNRLERVWHWQVECNSEELHRAQYIGLIRVIFSLGNGWI